MSSFAYDQQCASVSCPSGRRGALAAPNYRNNANLYVEGARDSGLIRTPLMSRGHLADCPSQGHMPSCFKELWLSGREQSDSQLTKLEC